MNRPFKLHKMPPITLEIKYGVKTSRAAKKLDHFLIVTREREKNHENVDNYKVLHDIIEQVVETNPTGVVESSSTGKKYPTIIPITLMSDNVDENFGLFRAFFSGKGELNCGSKYGDEKALRRFFFKGDFEEGTEESDVDVPYEVDCSDRCPFWNLQIGGRVKSRCDITGTFYFKLSEELPRSNELAALRIKGTWAQRSLTSSLELISKTTGGILANLPLQVRLHFETKKSTQDGRYYSIPFINVEPACKPMELIEHVKKEIARREEVFKIFNRREPTSIDELYITDILSDINSRDAVMATVQDVVEEVDSDWSEEDAFKLPEEVGDALDGLPEQFQALAVDKFTDDEGKLDVKELREFAEREKERRENPFEI